MRRFFKVFSLITGISVGSGFIALIAVLAGITLFVRTEFFQSRLRDQIVDVARKELQANITFASADISLFRLEPKIEFNDIIFEHSKTQVFLKINKLSVGISLFVSVPLLFVKQLHLSSVEVNGLAYDLKSLRVIKEWVDILRPKYSFLPSSFQTSVKSIGFRDVSVGVSLDPAEFYGEGINGNLFLKDAEVDLSTSAILFSGDVDLNEVRTKSYGPLSANVQLTKGVHTTRATSFHRLIISRDSDRAEISGEIKQWSNPLVNFKGLIDAKIQQFIPNSPIHGRIKSLIDISGSWKNLGGHGTADLLDMTLRDRSWPSLKAKWHLKSSRMSLEAVDTQGLINAKVHIPFSTPEDLSIDLQLNNASVGNYMGCITPELQSWTGGISGRVWAFGRENFKINWDVYFKNLDIRAPSGNQSIISIPELSTKGDMTLSVDGKTQLDAVVGNQTSSIKVNGGWGHQKIGLKIDSQFFGKHFGKLFSHDIAIDGAVRSALSGSYRKWVLSGEPNFKMFRIAETELTQFKGQYVYADRLLSAVPLNSDQISFYGGLKFGSESTEFHQFRFVTKEIDPQLIFQLIGLNNSTVKTLKGKLSSRGHLRGPLSSPIGAGSIILRDWSFYKMLGRGKLASGKWATAGSEIFFDQISLRFGQDDPALLGEMSFDKGGLVDLSLDGENFKFSGLQDFFGITLPIQARADLSVDYQRDLPSLYFKCKARQTMISGFSHADSNISLDWIRDEVKLDLSIFGDAFKWAGSVKQNRLERLANFSYEARDFNLMAFTRLGMQNRMEFRVSGSGNIKAVAKGSQISNLLIDSLNSFPNYSGSIELRSALVVRGGVVLHRVDPLLLKIVTGTERLPEFQFKEMKVRSEQTELVAGGYFQSPDRHNIEMKGSLDMRLVAGFNHAISRSEGLLDVDGLLEPSGFFGKVSIRQGLLNFQNSPFYVKNVEGSVVSRGNRVVLDELKGDLREGSVTAKGTVDLERKQIVAADFSLSLMDTLFTPTQGVSFRANGPLGLKIRGDDGEVSGRLSIKDGSYRRRLDAKANILKFFTSSRTPIEIPKDDVSGWRAWKLKIDVDSSSPFVIRNNLMDGSAHLNMKIIGTVAEPRFQGAIILVGGQFYYMNRQFVVRSGSVQFTDPTSNIPVFDIRADSEIDIYKVFIQIKGSANDQKISYSSDPALTEKDILSLVVSGFRASDPLVQAQDQTRSAYYSGISFVTGQFQDQIEGGLYSGFGIRRFGLSPAFSETTKSTELQLTVGTDLIRNRLEVNYSNLLSTKGGHKVELELKMTRVVSLIGSWRNVEGGSDQDFGGDLRFRFEFE